MGSGSSTAGTASTAEGGPSGSIDSSCAVTCPLFYNSMPNKLVVPDGVLPHFDARRMLKGCAARVTMLRPTLMVPTSVKPASTSPVASFLSGASGSHGHTVGVAEICLSAPYLITFTVDADGRLAPSDGESVRATPTTSGVPGIKGFNFKKSSPAIPDQTKSGAPPLANGDEPKPSASAPPPPPEVGAAHVTGGPPPSQRAPPPSAPTAPGSPSLPVPGAVLLGQPGGHPTRPPHATDSDASPAPSPVPSVLVKESTLLTREGSLRKDGTELGSGRGAGLGLKKRSSKRLARLQVPHRTRYCLYNDSLTHEAQITLTVLYRRSDDPLRATKVLCLPTPHVASTGGRPCDTVSSASRTYVEVCEDDARVNPATFTALLRTPYTPEEKRAYAAIRPADKGGAALEVRVVLAPGATVAAVESSRLLGYHVACCMVPFDDKKSLAVVGRYASAGQVQSLFVTVGSTALTSAVEMALVKADAKNKTQELPKNKPIKLSLGFTTQYVREDTTDADGWAEAPTPGPASAAAVVTPHARAELERHLADVPYVTSITTAGGGSLPVTPVSPPSRGAFSQTSPKPTASPRPSAVSTTPISPIVRKAPGPAAATSASGQIPQAQQHQLSARANTSPSSSLAVAQQGPGPVPHPRSSSHTGLSGAIPSPPLVPLLSHPTPITPAGPTSGLANGHAAPPLEVRELNSSKLSLSSSRMPHLAEPPSPTRSPTGRQPRLSGPNASNVSSARKSFTSASSATAAAAQPAQRSLAAGPLPPPSSSSSAPVLEATLKPGGEPTTTAIKTAGAISPKSDADGAHVMKTLPTITGSRNTSAQSRKSSSTQSLDDLGISF